MRSNFERQYTPEQSLFIAEHTLNQWELSIEMKAAGEKLQSYHCKLTDAKSKNIFYGCGKGLGLQSKASAIYEALEHYATHAFCQRYGADEKNYLSLTESALAGDLIESGLLPAGFLQNQNIEDRIPFVRLEHIHQEKQFNYPLFLVDPRYAKKPATQDTYCYKPYAWLASDSGTASGTSVVEASIHALNEIIERDAYSLFLMHAFIKPRKNKLKLIDKITIPENLRLMIADIERTYSDELMIFDMTSDIGIPSVLVSFTRQNHLFQPKGCGTSLNRAYALERALLESLQPLHIVNDELMNNQLSIMDNFAATPLLYKCAQAKVDLLYEFTQSVDFNSLPDYGHTLSLEQQLGMIKNALTSHGFDLYHHVIASEKSGFTCVKYVVPKMERFYLVQTGKFIFPGQRGVNVLNSLR